MNSETLSTTKAELLAELHKDIFLTPKGMLKFVQLFVVICAFAMTTSASGTSTLSVGQATDPKMKYDVQAQVKVSYPFDKYHYIVKVTKATTVVSNIVDVDQNDIVKDGFQSESQFYVFVGVISFLYTLIAIICYAFYKKFEKMGDLFGRYFTKVDFLATVLITFLWFLSVTLWSAGFSALRNDLSPPLEFPVLIESIKNDHGSGVLKELCPAPHYPCIDTDSWSKLYGSVVFGYLCILLYLVNGWYCFKDTEWHAEPGKLSGLLHLRTDNEPAPPARPAGLDDVNLEAGGGRDTATIQPGAI